MEHKTIQELKKMMGLGTSNRNTATTNTIANTQTNQGKRVGGFTNKRHDQATKNRISASQKARYALMRQQMGQHQQQQESHAFGPILDLDSPKFAEKVRDIVRELLQEEIKKAVPTTRQNIPIF